MRKILLIGGGLISFGLGIFLLLHVIWSSSSAIAPPSPIPSSPVVSPVPERTVNDETRSLPNSLVHIVTIPNHHSFQVVSAVSETVETVEEFAQRTGAIAVINGGFFDPQNQKSTSYITVQTEQIANPRENERLMNNPNLQPYLEQILNRSEFRQYQCVEIVSYDIALHSETTPEGCSLIYALGAGPRLLPQLNLMEEGFLDTANGQIIRDVLGSRQRNARSAIALRSNGDILWVMVAQRPDLPTNSGMSIDELVSFLRTLDVEQAMNLDGGSSTSLYYQGRTVYGKINEAGDRVIRPVKSVLLVIGK